ncbi:SKP1-like protein 1 [Diospyros lotus]|uniref:SKP1-like protein 1 n=1 Tax=Diospyros lotus TaxID=55363 RepID=UPI002256E0D0|nr:SKP1-like protein 1 [Diospyros lotus]
MVALKSSENVIFQVDCVAMEAQNMVILLPNVMGETLARVIQYCDRHANAETAAEELQNFDAEFVDVDLCTLLGLLLVSFTKDRELSLCDKAGFVDIMEVRGCSSNGCGHHRHC